MTTSNFTTKQEGYGRQGLYFRFDGQELYITSVFPNIPEQFEDYELHDDCNYDEETGIFTNNNGREVTPIDSWDEFLLAHYEDEIGDILSKELDRDNYQFDFDNSTGEQIINWAVNY